MTRNWARDDYGGLALAILTITQGRLHLWNYYLVLDQKLGLVGLVRAVSFGAVPSTNHTVPSRFQQPAIAQTGTRRVSQLRQQQTLYSHHSTSSLDREWGSDAWVFLLVFAGLGLVGRLDPFEFLWNWTWRWRLRSINTSVSQILASIHSESYKTVLLIFLKELPNKNYHDFLFQWPRQYTHPISEIDSTFLIKTIPAAARTI